jgi:hypothetical protein
MDENVWVGFKREVRSKYPDFKKIPFWRRLKIKATEYPSECRTTWESDDKKTHYSLTYLTRNVDGVEYFERFGGLKL